MCRKTEFWLDANLSDNSGTNSCLKAEKLRLAKRSGGKHFSINISYGLTSLTASVSGYFFLIP